MIVVVLLVDGWLGWLVRSARIQREAVAAIQRAGGRVQYHRQTPNNTRWQPQWLVERTGIDYLDHVDSVVFFEACSDADVGHAARSRGFVALHLAALTDVRGPAFQVNVTDAGLVPIEALTGLEQLSLGGTQVTDAGLVHINGLTKLEMPGLEDTAITEEGLAHVEGHRKMFSLHLGRTHVNDSGLADLQGLVSLTDLDLSGTQVTDAGLARLSQVGSGNGLK